MKTTGHFRLAIWVVFGWFSAQSLLWGHTAYLRMSENHLSLRDETILDFKGEPVESFVSNDQVFFSLDAAGVLRAYVAQDLGAKWDEVVLRHEVRQASVGSDFILILTVDGQLFRHPFGVLLDSNGFRSLELEDQENPISEDVQQISAGPDYFLFVLHDGTLMGGGYDGGDGRFGSNQIRSLSEPIVLEHGVLQASAGASGSLFIKENGDLWGMGSNQYGNLGLGHFSTVYVPQKIAEDVAVAKSEWDASWFINKSNHLYYMGKSFSGTPSFVADSVVDAAIDEGSGRIVWLNDLGEHLDAFLTDNGINPHTLSSWTRGLSIIARYRGFLYVKSPSPLFVTWHEVVQFEEEDSAEIQSYQFLTISGDELDLVTPLDDSWSGVLINHYVEQGPVMGAKPVYRFKNTEIGCHFYTISEQEKNSLEMHPFYKLEGVAYYAWDFPHPGTKPVYRLYSDVVKAHAYTKGEHNLAWLANHSRDRYQYEGVAYYAW